MKTVSILYKPRVAQAPPLAQEIAGWLEKRGCRVELCKISEGACQVRWQKTDLLITLGGDGSILRAAHSAAPHGTPLLGINLGRVGFLTETEPETWRNVLSRLLVGDYWIETRMMLRVEAHRGENVLGQTEALNDLVIGRGARAQVVHLCTEVDGGYLTTYVADGLIVATPTGSTAYALAAGGPILPPQLRNILLMPVAPHLSLGRPIVLPEGAQVRVTVTENRPAVLTVDGEIYTELASGDEVVVDCSSHEAHFVRVQEQTYFYKTLVARLVPRK